MGVRGENGGFTRFLAIPEIDLLYLSMLTFLQELGRRTCDAHGLKS